MSGHTIDMPISTMARAKISTWPILSWITLETDDHAQRVLLLRRSEAALR